MRLTRAGVALLIFLLIACPVASAVSYLALTGRLGGNAAATATPTTAARVPIPTTQPLGTPLPTAPSAAQSPTPTRVLGVVPLTPSTAPSSAPASSAPAQSPTVAAPRPSGGAGATATAPRASTTPAPAGASLAVAYDTYAPYFPVRIAATQGYFQARNLNVQQIPFGLNGNDYDEAARRAALRDGKFDVLLTTLDAVALFGDDKTGKVVAIVDESAGADKIVARNITRINDLRGKSVAFSAGSVAEFYLYASLNLAGLKATDVQLRPVESVDKAVELFTGNQVDAVVGWEPTIQDAINSPNAKVVVGSDNYRAIVDVVVVSTKALQEKPAAVQSFMDAWFEAVKLTTDDPQAAGAAVVKSGDPDWTGIARPQDFVDALGLVAQATLGQNAFALRDASLLGGRLTEIQGVWRAGGKTIATVPPASLIDGSLVQKSSGQGALDSAKPPVNPSFVLTSKIALPQLSPAQIGQTQAVAELPLKQIDFAPNSAILTDKGRQDLLAQVVPILKQTPGLYLKVDGSAAQPLGDTAADNEAFASQRAQAVIFFLIGQGIDANRLIPGYVKPQFPGSTNEAELQQDRRVIFTLVQVGGR